MLTGSATTATGAGAAVGAFLVIEGMGMTAFGVSQIAIGLAADPTSDNKQLASELPQSITDIGGIVADKAAGNENGEIRSAVQIGSILVGMGLGFTIDTNDFISWSSLATSGTQTAVWGIDNASSSVSRQDELPLKEEKNYNPDPTATK